MSKSQDLPDSIDDRLVGALVRLLKERSLAAISVREIAAEAGVNHGLVHRHFGSKAALVQAAARRISDEIHRGHAHGAMSATTFAYLRGHPEIARVMARACLDGPTELTALAAPSPERLAEIVAPIRRALARAGLDDTIDPHVLNALFSAMFLGWFVFQPMLAHGFGLPADADDRVADLMALVDALLPAGAA
jgi:TetR/AcrR family transcriptional regulator, repressor for neighboring sulfatase